MEVLVWIILSLECIYRHLQLRGVPAFLFIRHRASAAVSSSESNYLN